MVTGVSDINTDPGFDKTISPDMGPGGNMGLNVPMVSDGSPGHSDWYAPSGSMVLRHPHGLIW